MTCMEIVMYEVSRKPPRMDVTIQPTRYFVHKV